MGCFNIILELPCTYITSIHFFFVKQNDLKEKEGTLDRCPGLGDFCNMECSHTGKNVGDWLHKTHASVGCEPSFIGTVVVDRASNAGKSV